jgi:hypothetical protein
VYVHDDPRVLPFPKVSLKIRLPSSLMREHRSVLMLIGGEIVQALHGSPAPASLVSGHVRHDQLWALGRLARPVLEV